MLLENLTPDYVGMWESDIPPYSGSFEMYILQRNVRGITSPEQIEGVITDPIGLAIFSGEMTHRGIRFTKVYSPVARKDGYANELLYEGVINEDGNVVGQWHPGYQFPIREKESPKRNFRMNPIQKNLVESK